MAVVMVLHAEGPGEVGHSTYGTAPGDSLLTQDLGPAHVLVQRVINEHKNIPADAIDFKEPLRTKTGAHAYGSALLQPRILDTVLGAWLESPLVILLVDADDKSHSSRLKILRDALTRNSMDGAAGVAIREFESWLIADAAALRSVFGSGKDTPVNIESMDRREAKQLLTSWVDAIKSEHRPPHSIRRQLASSLNLDTVSQRCPSFDLFCKEIAALNM